MPILLDYLSGAIVMFVRLAVPMHILLQKFKNEEVEDSVEVNWDIVLDASGKSCVTDVAYDSHGSSTQCSQPEESQKEFERPIAIAILASYSVVNTCLHQVCRYYIFYQ